MERMPHQAILPSVCWLCTYLLNRPSNIMCVWPVCVCDYAPVCISGTVLDSRLKSDSGSVMSSSVTSRTTAHQAPLSKRFSKQEYCMGWHSLLQGIFPTQELNLGLLHCRQILYHLSHQGSPWATVWEKRDAEVMRQGMMRGPASSQALPSWSLVSVVRQLEGNCGFRRLHRGS